MPQLTAGANKVFAVLHKNGDGHIDEGELLAVLFAKNMPSNGLVAQMVRADTLR